MKIEDANAIPMLKILDKLELKHECKSAHKTVYRSPFDKRDTAILAVDLKTNTWSDDHLNAKGKPIDFVCAWLGFRGEHNTIADAKRWLKNIALSPPMADVSQFADCSSEENSYQVRGILPLMHFLLVRYVESRSIPHELAREHLREVRVLNTASKKIFRAIGIRNEDGGYFICNSHVKANVAPSTISFIRGEEPKPPAIHVFKDVFDFLSILTYGKGKPFKDDCIILNAWACLNDVFPYLKNYGYEKVYTWLDNTDIGMKATNALDIQFKSEDGLQHIPMNSVYEGYTDPNAWLMSKSLTK